MSSKSRRSVELRIAKDRRTTRRRIQKAIKRRLPWAVRARDRILEDLT